MTDEHAHAARSIRLRFVSTPEALAETGIGASLALLSPRPNHRINDLTLYIEYVFPAVTAAEIQDALRQSAGSVLLTAASRLRCRLRAILEENERDRLSLPRGWRRQVREVYSQYLDRRRNMDGDSRRQQWRKEKKGTGD